MNEIKKELKTLREEEIIILQEYDEKKKELNILNENKEKIKTLIINKEKEEYQIKVAKGNKEIRIMNIVSGDVITLKNTVNIASNTLLDLYNIIQKETDKVNISSIIINQYSYTHKNYTENNYSSLVDTITNRSKLIIKPKYNTYNYINFHDPNNCEDIEISILLDENYNNDYIEVSIIFGTYINYIKKIIDNHFLNERMFAYVDNKQEYSNNNYEKQEEELKKKEYKEIKNKIINEMLISKLNKLDNNCISLNDYELIKLYIVNISKIKNKDSVLNQIKNYVSIMT